jgi:hypothetical protein
MSVFGLFVWGDLKRSGPSSFDIASTVHRTAKEMVAVGLITAAYLLLLLKKG